MLGLSGGLDSTLALLVAQNAAEILQWDTQKIVCVTMPGFGTTSRTKNNAETLAQALQTQLRIIPIVAAVQQHFTDISHSGALDITYENAQARERTQILMDIANMEGGLVIGTGDLSEIALGWSTYNADHMSMYNVNAGVPKTLVQHIIQWFASTKAPSQIRSILEDILATPISPELLPTKDGEISQKTESVVGPYILHDFFLYHWIRLAEPIEHVGILALYIFKNKYSDVQIFDSLYVFVQRFIQNQFKRSCMPDGPKVGTVSLSPRADWRMPSDASIELYRKRINLLRLLTKDV